MRKIVVSFDALEKRKRKENKPVAMKDMVENLEKLRTKSGSTGVHFTMNNIHQTKGLTAVLAVYKDEQPVHQVLDKLYKWADETGQEDVKRKMDELKQDMKWNEDNPV